MLVVCGSVPTTQWLRRFLLLAKPFGFMIVASLKRDGDTLNEVHDRCVVAVRICGDCVLFGLNPSDSGIRFPSIVMSHRFYISCVQPVS
jgi:hypothetical protein